MADVINLTQKLEERRCKNTMALHAELMDVVHRHRRYGTTATGVIFACGVLLADLLAAMDPELEHVHLRELVYNFIDTHADELLLKKWESENE